MKKNYLFFVLLTLLGCNGESKKQENNPEHFYCWDTNSDGTCNVEEEDINGDNECTVSDCAGLRDERGLPGPQGERGESGEKGERGERGERGENGNAGPQGEKGDMGDKGDRGAPGTPGEKGEKGDNGKDGEPAVCADNIPPKIENILVISDGDTLRVGDEVTIAIELSEEDTDQSIAFSFAGTGLQLNEAPDTDANEFVFTVEASGTHAYSVFVTDGCQMGSGTFSLTVSGSTSDRFVEETITTAVGSVIVIKDTKTGIMWQKVFATGSRDQAAKHCKELMHAGFTNWYLPTHDDFRDIIDPLTGKTDLPYVTNTSHWTSTRAGFSGNSPTYWTFDFQTGRFQAEIGLKTLRFRCARSY